MAKVKCPKCFHVNPDGQEQCVQCHAPLPRIRIDAQPASGPPAGSFGEPSEAQFRRGQVVAARYSVQNLIGRGGMGAIYKVHDNVLGETVALKTLLPQFVRDKLVVERFFNEAKIARRLAHPNIVRVHDIGNADGSVYISMEYVQGISLRAMLEGLPAGQRLTLVKVLAVVDALCAALEYAHQYTIHRDIKPENVMVTADGTVKLMDFGISKLMADTRMTAASVVMGTPFYMSPEQLKNSRDVDARADIYSVGIVLYEALTGNVPTGVPKPASQLSSEVPPALDAIILRCVAADPRERYANATELRAALRPIIDLANSGGDLSSLVRRENAPAGPGLPWKKVVGWVLLGGLFLGAAGGLFALEAQRKQAAADAASAAEATPAPVAEGPRDGKISWDELVLLVADMDRVAAKKAGDPSVANAKECNEMYRRARQNWQAVQDTGGALTAEQHDLLRNAVQYYVAVLMAGDTRGMVFIYDSHVDDNGKTVRLDPFFIDEHEVTNEDWNHFCAGSKVAIPACRVQAPADADAFPVVNVSYFDAECYAVARQRLLPTNAQWSAAAFANADPAVGYPWGDEPQEGAANVLHGTGEGAVEPVGSHAEDHTKSGLFDLAGNVAEWTRSTAANARQAKPDFGVAMTVRGGSYRAQPVPLSFATAVEAQKSSPDIGFRCVLEVPTDPEVIRELLKKVS